jgi:4-phospho-D-threonate 3-dehydrogenase / 4-phospho-D-erythronate 3-dehydrogenase
MKPVVAITMGDPAGIGPEIAAKLFATPELFDICRPLLIGNSIIMKRAIQITKSRLEVHSVTGISEADFRKGKADIYNLSLNDPDAVQFGRISAEAGDLAFRIIRKAIDLAMIGDVDAVVTGPIQKSALHASGHLFAGHTEIFSHFTGTKKYAMLLADDKIKVIHVSTHVSLRKACDLVKKDRVKEVIVLMYQALKMMGIENPRIGVAGLNPHAGDNGLFGEEELNEIIPAIEEIRNTGIEATGPLSPDTLFVMAAGGRFDGCVAMFHDQGHIPFKLTGFEWDEHRHLMKSVKGVNITLGLPIIRTSVDHGTAFEIAGKGIASPEALMNAVRYALKMTRNKTDLR